MDYIIVFKDRTTLAISKEAFAMIEAEKKKSGRIEELRIGSSVYKYSSFDKILSLDDYFEQYPDKRPEKPQNFVIPREEYQSIEERAFHDKNRATSLIKGLMTFIENEEARGAKCPHAKALLANWKIKHKKI